MKETDFKSDAKEIVDVLFNTELFKKGISRDNMLEIEELIQYMMFTRTNSYIKARDLFDKIAG